MNLLKNIGIAFAAAVLMTFVGAILVRIFAYTFVDNYEMAYSYNGLNGKLSKTDRTGYIFHLPIVESIHTIDLRPMQLCLSANTRVLNCKLVKFNPEGFETFVAWHGRADYITGVNMSQGGVRSYTQFGEIMMSYAFSKDTKVPFLTEMPVDGQGMQ